MRQCKVSMFATAAVLAVFLVLGNFRQSHAVIAGVGVSSCAEFAKAYGEDPTAARYAFLSWAQGFMTALNVAIPKAENRADLSPVGFDASQQFDYLRGFCDKRPLAEFTSGVVELTNKMRKEQGLGDWLDALGR